MRAAGADHPLGRQLAPHGRGLRQRQARSAGQHRGGGGYKEGAGAQEENLHRRSDTYRFLEQKGRKLYPIPDDGCLLSRNVTVFRGSEKDGYPFLDRPFRASIISCAAIEHPVLDASLNYAYPQDVAMMRVKIAVILAAAAKSGCDAVVLSAFGCGAFGNPPVVVAALFAQELKRTPLKHAVFCVFDDHNARSYHNPSGNVEPFMLQFGGC